MRYLARAWVTNPQVELRAQTYADFATALGAPSLVPAQVVELRQGGVAPRLAVATIKGDWMIQVGGESVDVQYSPPLGGSSLNLQQFCATAGPYLAGAMGFLEGQAHRIAVIQEGLLRELSPEELASCAGTLLNVPRPFDQSDLFEWDWRAAVELHRHFGGTEEPTNTIATVKRVKGQTPLGQELDRLLVATDINTKPTNNTPRFGAAHLRAFLEQAPNWHADLSTSLLDFMGIK